MIYTVTLNPSLDDYVSVPEFRLGKTNRAEEERLVAGGKGINVSHVLTALGIPNTALGFTAGFTGEEIERQLKEKNIYCDFIRLPGGISRINVKLSDYEGTEINGRGPVIGENDLDKLREKLFCLKEGDVLVLSGSIPAGVPKTLYADLMRQVSGRGVKIIVDAAGEALRSTLPLHPFLIKPNRDELEEIIGADLQNTGDSAADVLRLLALRLQKRGARNVLISLAGDGAALLDADGRFHIHRAPAGKLVNGVGAGDSMVAGFLAGFLQYHDYEEAFLMGLAAGSASAYQEGLAGQQEITCLYEQMKEEDNR